MSSRFDAIPARQWQTEAMEMRHRWNTRNSVNQTCTDVMQDHVCDWLYPAYPKSTITAFLMYFKTVIFLNSSKIFVTLTLFKANSRLAYIHCERLLTTTLSALWHNDNTVCVTDRQTDGMWTVGRGRVTLAICLNFEYFLGVKLTIINL